MNRFARIGRIAGYIIAALLLFTLLTVLFIPAASLLDTINRGIASQGLSLVARDLGKAFPLGITGTGWTLSSARGELLKLDSASLRLQLLPLLRGRLSLGVMATVGAGRLEATVSSAANGSLSLEMHGIRLEQIPFFATVADTRAAGIVSAQVQISGMRSNGSGFVKLDARGVDLAGIKLGEMPLPDAAYQSVQGMIRLTAGTASIESFTLQGDGLYVRLKGDIRPGTALAAAPLEMTLELMPKPEFLEKQKFIFLLLAKYLDTPGHYQLPIRGTLGKPLME
jgi:type II secretion system protein N